ncbi:MAG: transglycosylase SLT domain-containing protein [Gemmatimonadota bacterium]|nr:transglycosylase SLT domain-containing protein [Gemmatimonadota bacterium]
MTVIPAGAPMEGHGDSVVATPAGNAHATADPRATWDIDVRSFENEARVAHFVEIFSGRAKAHVAAQLSAGSRYEAMIRARMREGGIPEDMYYLALIESGFNPNAYSRAAAVGMWQFMTSTARDAGLRVDWWVDERRDPVRSTSAAVRFIRELKDQFGSLYLAAAAYNGGPGRVSRGLAKYASDVEGSSRDAAFFLIADKDFFKNETRDYVPQLIAAALIGKEPARYGMELRVQPAFAYDSVEVPASTPLAAVAKAAGALNSEIVELNPHLLRGMTPPRETTIVRLPTGSAGGFAEAFAALPHDALVATRLVESKKGDTADRLAERHGISARSIKAFNPGLRTLKSGRLAIGQAVLLPSPSVAALALKVPDPAIEKFPRKAKASKAHATKKGAPAKRKHPKSLRH